MEVVGLILSMVYAYVVWWSRTLDLVDAAVLVVIYVAYLAVLSRMPPMEENSWTGREEVIATAPP